MWGPFISRWGALKKRLMGLCRKSLVNLVKSMSTSIRLGLSDRVRKDFFQNGECLMMFYNPKIWCLPMNPGFNLMVFFFNGYIMGCLMEW